MKRKRENLLQNSSTLNNERVNNQINIINKQIEQVQKNLYAIIKDTFDYPNGLKICMYIKRTKKVYFLSNNYNNINFNSLSPINTKPYSSYKKLKRKKKAT